MVQENAAAAAAGNPGGKKRNRNRNKKNKNKQPEGASSGSPPPAAAAAPEPVAPTNPLPPSPPRSRSGSDEAVAAPTPATSGKNKQNKNKATPAPEAVPVNGHSNGANDAERSQALVKNLAMDFGSSALFSGTHWFQLQEAERNYHENKAVGTPSNGNGRAPAASSDSDDIDFFDDAPSASKPKMVKPEPRGAPASKKQQQQKKDAGKKQQQQQQQQSGKKQQKQQRDAEDSDENEQGQTKVATASNTACRNPANAERSFVMLKPDAVHRGLMGEIVNRLEARGFKLCAAKFMKASEDLLRRHYADLSKKGFFGELVRYMASGPVVPMVWEGLHVVKTVRVMLGETNPQASKPGTIRGDLCIDVGRNIIHASDSTDAANHEIGMWFSPSEVASWKPCQVAMVYEDEEEEEEGAYSGSQQNTPKSGLAAEIAKARQHIKNSLECVDGLAALAGAPNAELTTKVKKLEGENKDLKKITNDLKSLVLKLETRVNQLEKGGKAAAAADEDDDDVDLFGSDSEEEDDAEKNRIRDERLKAYHEKKAKKPTLIAKTSVLLDVKPWDDEADHDAMLKQVKSITQEGLLWGASKLVPIGYGIKKLQVMCVVEDDKVSIEELCEKICEFEDFVQSCDISSMSKI